MSNFSKWKQHLDFIGIVLQSHLQIYLEIAEIAQFVLYGMIFSIWGLVSKAPGSQVYGMSNAHWLIFSSG